MMNQYYFFIGSFFIGSFLFLIILFFTRQKKILFNKSKNKSLSTEKLLELLEEIYKKLLFSMNSTHNLTSIKNLNINNSDQFLTLISKKIKQKNDQFIDIEFIARSVKNRVFIDILRFDIKDINNIKLVSVLNQKEQK